MPRGPASARRRWTCARASRSPLMSSASSSSTTRSSRRDGAMASGAEAEGGGGRLGGGLWLPGLTLSGAAILLRLAVASRREGIEVDGITYLNNARALLGDIGAFTVLHPPLYSVLLAPRLVAWRAPRRVLAGLAVLTVVWFAVLSPYMALVKRETGRWHWSGKLDQTLAFAESVGDERPGAAIERAITEPRPDVPRTLVGYVLAHPGEVASRILVNLHLLDKYVAPALLQSGGIALLALGLVQLRYGRGSTSGEWFLAVA